MSRRFAVILLHFMLCFCMATQSVTQVSGVADSTHVVVLNSSTIVATVNPVKVLEDTVEYNPAAHRLAEDATLEDVLRKIPGLEINDGVVTLHGREIKQILIDGQRFFAGDIKAGLQNISADMISRVRSYEKESDFARMTGVDDGEREPVLDVKVKKNAIGSWNGTIGGCYGMHNRYVGKANVIRVDKNQQIAIMADFNDLNGKISINNASRTQLGGGSAGDAHRRSAGVNYSLKQKKFKCDINASYSGSDALKKSDTFTERIYYDGITSFQGNGGGKYGNNVPSLEGKFEWTPVRDLVILVKPSFKYTDNRNDTRTTGTNYTIGGKFSSDVDNANVNGQNNFNSSLQFSVVIGNLPASDIIKKLVKFKAVRYARSIRYHYVSIKASYAGMDVMLFFYRKGKGSWNALISTDTSIDAKEAFKLYSRRWVTEVAHKEMKGLLNLGKCQCIDFAGQIAGLSLCMIQYNILGCVKRFEAYETIGGLFAEVIGETVELSVAQRIWGLIVEVINVIAEFIACDPFELIENVINNNNQIKAVKQVFDRLELAETAA